MHDITVEAVMNNISENSVMTPREIALKLRISEPTVTRMLVKGEIPGHKIGKQWRVYVSDFESYLAGTRNDLQS